VGGWGTYGYEGSFGLSVRMLKIRITGDCESKGQPGNQGLPENGR